MLERLEKPHPADEGVDPRYMCLVVFLCEGGHHVTDWVSPGSMRPYLRHAAAYPYKKKAYAGTARLQVSIFVTYIARRLVCVAFCGVEEELQKRVVCLGGGELSYAFCWDNVVGGVLLLLRRVGDGVGTGIGSDPGGVVGSGGSGGPDAGVGS